VAHSLTIPGDWVSGVYLARLVRQDTGGDAYVQFVVRDDARKSEVLTQISQTTYQAYNFYGNKSLYSSISPNICPTVSGAPRAVKVSLNRPDLIYTYAQNNYFWTDYSMVYWLEAQGYDVSYSNNIDTHHSGSPNQKNQLLDHKIFISLGHDEYWSQEMRNAITQARDAGVNLTFFSSNVSYWRIRLEPDPWTGKPDQVIVTYKTTESGAADPSGQPTTTWRDPQGVNDPENSLIGIQYIGDNDIRYFPLRVDAQQARNSIYRKTGLQEMPDGSYAEIGKHLIGWEWDGVVKNGRSPANLQVLASSPALGPILDDAGRLYHYDIASTQSTLYTAASGARVFAAGTNQWTWGLAVMEPNHIIQQVTYNLFSDMGVQPATPAASLALDSNVNGATSSGVDGVTFRDTVIASAVEEFIQGWAVPDFKMTASEAASSGEKIQFKPSSHPNTPAISNLKVTSTYDQVTISWETDRPTDGQVWIKLASGPVDYRLPGESLGARPIVAEAAQYKYSQSHQFTIGNLHPNTDYYYHIAARDEAANMLVSPEQTFRTNGGGPIMFQAKSLLRPVYRNVNCWVPLTRRNIFLMVGAGLILVAGLAILAYRSIRRRRGTTNE
jgi:hypothetical protein